VPLAWFLRLMHATPEQRAKGELSRSGRHWDEIDEDIAIAGLLAVRGDMTRPRKTAAWSASLLPRLRIRSDDKESKLWQPNA
jgi:hypothetical protein